MSERLNMSSWDVAGQKSLNATPEDSKKGEWVGVEGDLISWYDASEISGEVLYLLARCRLGKNLKVMKRDQNTRKS